jgi:hypothetical protein
MGMKIDKARRQRQPCAVDHDHGLWGRDRPHLGDGITADSDIGDERWCTATVDDPSLLNQEIPHRTRSSALTDKSF